MFFKITDSEDDLELVEECRYVGVYLVCEDLNAADIMQSALFILHLILLAG